MNNEEVGERIWIVKSYLWENSNWHKTEKKTWKYLFKWWWQHRQTKSSALKFYPTISYLKVRGKKEFISISQFKLLPKSCFNLWKLNSICLIDDKPFFESQIDEKK